ncbi:MAG: D-alanyl-D-alanine carboxypeptidase family protein [Candidatus Latescibacterota bacterium]|jgi:D-alanyl-D-alanine carboxypeptidase (penicillin-binding protein 5/6)
MPLRIFAVCLCLVPYLAGSAVQAASYNPGARPPYASAILVEASTGAVLHGYRPTLRRSPASTQKILLELVVMDLLAQGKCSLTDSIRVSKRASRTGGSQVFLKEGEVFTLEELMHAVVLPSANDACVAVAEHLGGSVEGFAEMMMARARDLGLEDTYCVNVNGLDDTPDGQGNHTTAYDLAQIARTLITYPHVLEWSSSTSLPFRNGRFVLHNTNKLLDQFAGLDGLKTGYTGRAGFCLVATGQRRGMRLISVILGAPSERVRRRETARLLAWGFENFSKAPLVAAGEPVARVPVSWGREPEVPVTSADTVFVVLAPGQERQLVRQLEVPETHSAPVKAGQKLGVLRVSLGDSVVAQIDMVAARSVGRMGLLERILNIF